MTRAAQTRPTETHDPQLTAAEKAELRLRYPAVRDTRYADDKAAQRFVADHPEGATLETLGAVFGVSKQAIEQVANRAAKNFARRLAFALRGHPL